jgi:uncharacterized protein YoaH (UPF0181 family)
MKNAIRFIATGLVISLASVSFAQTNSNSELITAPTSVASKTILTNPSDATDKGRTDFQNFRNQHPAVAKTIFERRQQLMDNGNSKKEARKMLHRRVSEKRDGNNSQFEQFQDNHPRLANAIMDHRAAFARKGITGREAMHRVAAHRARVR